ncbi:hypothetical protein ABC347_07430 [Sphingomonas sp. 1P06PA]|uniref:hypothetical protein n=1 Tax=Sphingomonas sp. 1P06PA TaxID=554121 RepID=UPI0039A494A2
MAEVDWSQAGFAEPPPPHPARIAAVIRQVRLPVLIPAGFARYRSFDVVSTGPYDYTASILLPGAKLWINGSRQEVLPPPGAMAAQDNEPDPGAFVEPDPPGPVTLDRRFTRYGAGYVISAECVKASDRNCSDQGLAELERTLRVFGGSQ